MENPEGPRHFNSSGQHQFRPFQYGFFFFFVKYMNGYEPQLIPYNTLLGLKDTSISGNSRLWVESKPQQNFRVTGFRWAIALSGSGTLFMQGKQSTPCLLWCGNQFPYCWFWSNGMSCSASKWAGGPGCWWSLIGLGNSSLEGIRVESEQNKGASDFYVCWFTSLLKISRWIIA